MSEASSLASAASTSASSAQGCALCGNASRTRGAGESLPGIGPEFLATRTCEASWPTPTRDNRNNDLSVTTGMGRSLRPDKLGWALASEIKGEWCPCRCHASTSSPAASPANQSASPAKDSPRQTNAGSGPSSPDSFAYYDPATSSLRTSQGSLLEDSTSSSLTLPRSGSMRNGQCSAPGTLAHPTSATASGLSPGIPTPTAMDAKGARNLTSGRKEGSKHHSGMTLGDFVRLWPTPQAADADGGRIGTRETVESRRRPSGSKASVSLREAVTYWPTPVARDWKGKTNEARNTPALPDAVGPGPLNPTWVEWLMGFPTGWTDSEPSETPSSPPAPNTSDDS